MLAAIHRVNNCEHRCRKLKAVARAICTHTGNIVSVAVPHKKQGPSHAAIATTSVAHHRRFAVEPLHLKTRNATCDKAKPAQSPTSGTAHLTTSASKTKPKRMPIREKKATTGQVRSPLTQAHKDRANPTFLRRLYFPPLLIPPRPGSFAGSLFPSSGRKLFGASFAALLSSEPVKFYRRRALHFAHVLIIT